MSGWSTIRPTCVPYSCNGVGILSGPAFGQSRGTAGSSAVSADFAAAIVSVNLLPTGSLFSLEFQGSAATASTGLYWASSGATIIEGLHYTGPTNKSFTFAGRFSGTCSSPRTTDGLSAQVYLFRSTNFIYDTYLPDLIYEKHAQVITNFSLKVACTNSGATLSNAISATVAPGETFYLYASLSVSVFEVGVSGRTTSPLQVSCLNPEGLVSESMRTDFPLSISNSANQIQVRWPETRRQCTPEWTPALPPQQWDPVTNPVVSNLSGNLLTLPATANAAFFRTRIQ